MFMANITIDRKEREMVMVTRVFVEKKPGFNVEATGLCADLRKNLGIQSVEEVRILNRAR